MRSFFMNGMIQWFTHHAPLNSYKPGTMPRVDPLVYRPTEYTVVNYYLFRIVDINRIYLTPAGTEIAETLDDFRERVAREVLDGIDEAAIASALATLGEIKTRLAVENSIRPNRLPLRPAADEPAESRA